MPLDYIESIAKIQQICYSFEHFVKNLFFESGTDKPPVPSYYCLTPDYQESFIPIKSCVVLCEMFGLLPDLKFARILRQTVSNLEEPQRIKQYSDFIEELETVRSGFFIIEDELADFCSAFDGEERERINEAIHNLFENCYYSCVAMSVSAVESRLLKLMCLANPESKQELAGRTLGRLINEYSNNKGKYQNVVPEKHKPLLDLCNTYRIFSVHPKKEKIKGTIADSILHLAIEFLTDQDLKPETVKAKYSTT